MVDLSKNLLNGTIPSEVGDMESLQSLQLYNNDIEGFIPTELGKLKNLCKL